MSKQITITKEAFQEMRKLKEEFDSLVETIEIMNDRELREGLKKSKRDVKEGRIGKLKNLDDIDAW